MQHDTSDPRRVLVVEDEASLRRTVVRVLRRAGYDVCSVADGEEALDAIAESSFDVVVTDLAMPRVDGMSLVRALRDRGVDKPVIVMTGVSTTHQTATEALERGVTSYLQKPFSPEAVVAAVEKGLRRYQSVDAATRRLVEEYHALDRVIDSLYIVRQPIVSHSRRQVSGYECLLRASEPVLPHPGAILDAAERFGRLDELGLIVRQRAAELPPVGDASIFVNLHPLELCDPALFSPDAPLSQMSDRVVIEITERARLEEIHGAYDAIDRLRALGFRIALDDIGAGFASLSTLTTLAPDIVKIDMSLVRDIHSSRIKQHLVDALLHICRDHDIDVIAEGVETPEELDTLRDLGCDTFQGYLFAKPARGFPAPAWPDPLALAG